MSTAFSRFLLESFEPLCLSRSFLSGGSLSGSGGSSFSSLSGSSSLLLSHLLSNGLVHFLLLVKSLLGSILLGLSLFLAYLVKTLLLVGLPCIELFLGSSLVESALLHATAQVLHQEHALTAEDVANGISGLSAYL